MRRPKRPAAGWSRGKVLVMMGLLMPVLVGGVALGVDTAVVSQARAQLQTAADSAALAGAAQLVDENRVRGATDLSTEMSAARATAISFAGSNGVLNSATLVNDNPSNSSTGDVVIGYIDPNDHSSTLSTATQSL